MRQRLVSLVIAVAALCSANNANAQNAQQDIIINATVPKFCQFVAPATGGTITEVIPVSSAGVVTTTTISNTISTVECNAAATLTATSLSGGVKSATSAPSGFTNIIDYTGTATLDGTLTSSIDTSAIAAAAGAEPDTTPAVSAGPMAGDLVIDIDPVQPADPLVAGSYTDTLRVTLVPVP